MQSDETLKRNCNKPLNEGFRGIDHHEYKISSPSHCNHLATTTLALSSSLHDAG